MAVEIYVDGGSTRPSGRFLDRLDHGAGRVCVFAPHIGEFGHMVLNYARLVHFHKACFKLVCCRRGEEALFPSADAFDYEWKDPVSDEQKCGTQRTGIPAWVAIRARYPDATFISFAGLSVEEEKIPIYPEYRLPFRTTYAGPLLPVCLGPRVREFATLRNWPMSHWHRVARALEGAGFSFATIGKRPTGPDLPGQAMHSDGDLDAAIELLRRCKVYLGTDSGTSHLAAAVGCRMIVWRDPSEEGLFPQMRAINFQGFREIKAWDDPEQVIREAIKALED